MISSSDVLSIWREQLKCVDQLQCFRVLEKAKRYPEFGEILVVIPERIEVRVVSCRSSFVARNMGPAALGIP